MRFNRFIDVFKSKNNNFNGDIDRRRFSNSTYGIFYHGDVMKWKNFPCYSPFVRGIPHSKRYPRIEVDATSCRVFLTALYYICRLIQLNIQYIPRNMHTVFALLCFVMFIHWLIFPHPSGLLHWHCGNLTIAPVPAKQPWWIWINTSCEFIMNDCITTTKPCAYFLGYTVNLFNISLFMLLVTIMAFAFQWYHMSIKASQFTGNATVGSTACSGWA